MKVLTKWNLEKLQKEALKYQSRVEFKRKGIRAYSAATRRKILDKICCHMKTEKELRSKSTKWTIVKVEKEALKYKSKKDFEQFASGAYKVAKRMKILDKICTHMSRPKKVNKIKIPFNKKSLKLEALKYKSRTEFKKHNRTAFDYAYHNNLLDHICLHMGQEEKQKKIDKIKKNIATCQSRSEFYKKFSTDYDWCLRHNLLDKFSKHMTPTIKLQKKRRYWTKARLEVEALKFKTKAHFRYSSSGAYSAAGDLKIIDKICSHMKEVIEYREFKFQKIMYKKVIKFLKSNNISFNIEKEKRFKNLNNKDCRIDLLVTLPKYYLLLELKHDESKWSKESLIKQVEQYSAINLENKLIFIVSPKGKYGITPSELFNQIHNLIK